MAGSVRDVNSKAELDDVKKTGAPTILHFWAAWCEASKHMDQVFSQLATDFPHAHFLRVEAEEQPELSETYSVSAVPYFVIFEGGKAVDKLEGADPSTLASKIAKVAGTINPGDPAAPASLGLAVGPTVLETVKEFASTNASAGTRGGTDTLEWRLEQLIHSHPVMLFMKGSPEEPKCGFSRRAVDIMKKEKVNFGSFDIMSDNEAREGLKKFSNWLTYLQLHCKGELIGGCEILIAMHDSGELKEVFSDHGIAAAGSDDFKRDEHETGKGVSSETPGLSESLYSRIKTLVESSPVVLFTKGKPDQTRCGFSGKVVEILREERVDFKSSDILTDEEIRQGLRCERLVS